MILSATYIMTGDGSTVLENKAVFVGENGKINEIASKEELIQKYPEEELKEFGDATILPGLCDMHEHLGY